MACNNLPDADTVVRYVNKTYVRPGGKGVLGGAFYLRENEKGISVYWLQCFQVNTISAQLVRVRRAIRRPGYTMKRSGRLAELRVGETKERVNRAFGKHNSKIQFTSEFFNDSSEYKRSHSEIVGVPPPPDSPEAEMVADLIAESVIKVHEAVLDEHS